MTEAFNPKDIWQPFGAFFHGGGRATVRLCISSSRLDREGRVKATCGVQTRQALETSGLSWRASAARWATSRRSPSMSPTSPPLYGVRGDARRTFFQEPYPATTTVEVAAWKDLRLKDGEITAVGGDPEGAVCNVWLERADFRSWCYISIKLRTWRR